MLSPHYFLTGMYTLLVNAPSDFLWTPTSLSLEKKKLSWKHNAAIAMLRLWVYDWSGVYV